MGYDIPVSSSQRLLRLKSGALGNGLDLSQASEMQHGKPSAEKPYSYELDDTDSGCIARQRRRCVSPVSADSTTAD